MVGNNDIKIFGKYSIRFMPLLFIALTAFCGYQIGQESSAMTRRLTAANMQNSRLSSENAKLTTQQNQPNVTVIVPSEQQRSQSVQRNYAELRNSSDIRF
ncbi:hypothetical protein [Dickeya poaceiphila]|uniref:Uncharacterized protein n=1 Tax=Dickeya poaceiphila TaxID=568768 RepID=A0A5B8IAT0_9GAMM|nr:hypothetical protein [Dickeya poaceiphila]QDX29540.1 hypothetical protein Dpoa569_0001315 [Dickeya poaceiphila]